MSNKDNRIVQLEAEILAARKTIAGLTKAIEELSRAANRNHTIYYPPIYVQPYKYNYPYWTYTVGDIVYTSSVGTGNTNMTYTLNKNDDDEGDAGVRAAV